MLEWEQNFNKQRHGEYMKALRPEVETKIDEINRLMHENLDITEKEVERQLIEVGLRGLSTKDRWTYWTNREVLLRVREDVVSHRLAFGVEEWQPRQELQDKLSLIK